jgi:hypothetical protein
MDSPYMYDKHNYETVWVQKGLGHTAFLLMTAMLPPGRIAAYGFATHSYIL